MFCPNCGTQNTETAQTCAKCSFQLKTAAAPKFKGTMLMMNQPGSIPGAPPRPGSSPGVTPPQPAGGAPASGPGFTAEAAPIGAGAPPAGAAPAAPSRLKGTMVGVAPPSFGGPAGPAGPQPEAAPAFGAPPAGAHQTFGSAADANPLAGTMALDGPPNFANIPGAPAGGAAPPPPGAPAFGAPPPDAGGFNPPAFGAPPPDAGGGFGPPPGADPYGAPPGGGIGAPPQGAGAAYGAPPQGDPYGAGAPPGGAAYGAPPGGAPPQDFGAQMNQGFQQAGQQFGQAADQFGQQMGGGGMQPYQGGAPMMGQQPGMGGMPGAMTAGGPPKQFMITLLLALFAGGFGAHRFYTGHILFGVIQFFTLGGCGIWALIDIIMIVTGKYTDAQGRPLVK